MKPLVFDLFCGLGGWSEAFIAKGYRAIGFDIEAHDYGTGGYPGELVLRDIRSINGADLVKEYGAPACIVASPPCQEFSYMAMPWSKAKEKQRKIEADPAEQSRLTDLFNQCFRIQREVSAAAGHYVPMVVENVRGAQKWVGKARWNFGSFYLWGDVPALMPIPGKSQHGQKLPVGNSTSPLWSDQSKRGQDFTRIAGQQAVKVASESGRRTDIGNGTRFTSRDCGVEGQKGFRKNSRFNRATGQVVPGGIGDASDYSSKSSARKRASAEIAKIPPALASWIARTFKPLPSGKAHAQS
jgi:hypothetical protein